MFYIKDYQKKCYHTITTFVMGVIIFLVSVFGLLVNTPEYIGEDVSAITKQTNNSNEINNIQSNKQVTNTISKSKNLKLILSQKVVISFSRFLVIIFLGALIFILCYIIDKIIKIIIIKDKKINILENEKSHLTRDLTQFSLGVIKDNKFEKITEAMRNFALNNEEVISIQLYEYSHIKKDNYIKYEIKPTLYYYTNNGHEANLIHAIYNVEDKLIKEYNKVKTEFLKNDNRKLLDSYLKKLTDKLNKKFLRKSDTKINDEIIALYTLYTLALGLDLENKVFRVNQISQDIQKTILKAKRIGFLESIIENSTYIFKHNGDSNKGERIYVAKCLSIMNIPHMFVIILNPNIDYNGNVNNIISIGNKFYEILSQEPNLVYNDNIVGN